ncbi:MAG: hypothetical protein ABI083_01345 [Lapillicoccus sp.]
MTQTGAHDDELLVIVMSLSLWCCIDGGMDNKGNQARWEYWESAGVMRDPEGQSLQEMLASAAGCRDEIAVIGAALTGPAAT